MRKLTLLACVALIAALAIPTAAEAKKKKKTYCQKNGSAVKAKLLAKSNGFYVYREKGGGTVLLCQDKPKFYGSMSFEGTKVGKLLVVKKKCAIYSVLGKGNPKIYAINFADFLSRNGQASVFEVGFGATGQLLGMSLSQSCAAAYGTKVNGVPQIAVKGTSAFGYTGTLYPPVSTNITDKELANVKISGSATGTGATATVTWTDGGVPKSYVYQAQSRY